MRKRCSDPAQAYYYGKGITVSPDWSDFETFARWAESSGYSDALTIERLDSNGNYEPSNCTWATKTVQARNRSIVLRSPDGRSWAEIAEANGISASVLNNRMRCGSWPPEVAATWPLGKRRTVRERTNSGQWAPGQSNWKR